MTSTLKKQLLVIRLIFSSFFWLTQLTTGFIEASVIWIQSVCRTVPELLKQHLVHIRSWWNSVRTPWAASTAQYRKPSNNHHVSWNNFKKQGNLRKKVFLLDAFCHSESFRFFSTCCCLFKTTRLSWSVLIIVSQLERFYLNASSLAERYSRCWAEECDHTVLVSSSSSSSSYLYPQWAAAINWV